VAKSLISNFNLEMTGLFHYNKQEFYRNVQQPRMTTFTTCVAALEQQQIDSVMKKELYFRIISTYALY
jgi:hypothetical protein